MCVCVCVCVCNCIFNNSFCIFIFIVHLTGSQRRHKVTCPGLAETEVFNKMSPFNYNQPTRTSRRVSVQLKAGVCTLSTYWWRRNNSCVCVCATECYMFSGLREWRDGRGRKQKEQEMKKPFALFRRRRCLVLWDPVGPRPEIEGTCLLRLGPADGILLGN